MLRELCQLADRERLVAAGELAGYEMRPVRWGVRLTSEGQYLGLLDFKVGSAATRILVPCQKGRTATKAPPHFLVDNAKYVFGAATADKSFSPEDGAEKAAWFRDTVRYCATETGDQAVQAVVTFLDHVAQCGLPESLPAACKSNDLFAFQIESDRESFVHLRPAVRAYWQRQCTRSDTNSGGWQCLVTGQPMTAPELLPLIKGLPGATPSGAAIVSCNGSAFESYGWKRNENAPISKQAAAEATLALNRLLDPTFANPEGTVMPTRRMAIGAETVACFWSLEPVSNEFCRTVHEVLNPCPPESADTRTSLLKLRETTESDGACFYIAILSGAQGRAILRGWIETTTTAVWLNLVQHLREIDLVANTRMEDGRPVTGFSLYSLLRSLAPDRNRSKIPPALAARVVRSVFSGEPYPAALLATLLRRVRAEIGRSDWADSYFHDARAALLKAVLNRLHRASPERYGYRELLPQLDFENKEPGYLLGRRLAVIERLQQSARGNVYLSPTARHFAAAFGSPRRTFERLEQAAATCCRQLRGSCSEHDRRLASELDQLSQSMAAQLRAGDGKQYPDFLPLEQQGLFVVGYHQQRHWLWLAKAERHGLRSTDGIKRAA
jgi:CRISPR-associated protein Csd1